MSANSTDIQFNITLLGFYHASYANEVLEVVILSVRPSVRPPSVCSWHPCFVTNPKNLPAIFLHHMKGQSF